MDLAAFETTSDAVFRPLLNPVTLKPLTDESTKEAIGVFIFGVDSEAYQARRRELTNRRIRNAEQQMQQRRKIKSSMTAEELEKDDIETLAACIKGFRHVVLDGRPLTDSREDKLLFLTRLPWAREQIDADIGDRENFLKSSLEGSKKKPS